MKIRFFAMAVVWLLSGSLYAQAQVRVCSCADKEDLLNLLREVEISMQEVEYQFNKLEADAGGKSLLASPERLKELSVNIHDAVKTVNNKNYPQEEMNLDDCSVQPVNGSTDCVRQVTKRFSDFIQKRCLQGRATPGMEMNEHMRGLVTAYSEMQQFILQMLNQLPKDCRPNNWFGYVFYRKVQTDTSVSTYPPPPVQGELASYGGTSTLSSKSTYIGAVLVEGGKAVSTRAYAAYSRDKSGMSSQQMLCNTSDGIVTTVDTNTSKTFTEGEAKGDVVIFTLKVNPANRTYDLYAQQFPTVNTTGNSVVWSKSTYPGKARNCGGKESNRTEAVTIPVNGTGHYVTGEKIDPKSPDYLEGSRVVKPPEFNLSFKDGNTSNTKTFEIQFRWLLRRLPQK